MKRVLSFVVSFVLLVTSLSVGWVAVAETVPQKNSLERFAFELTDLVRKYDSRDCENTEAESNFDFIIQYNSNYNSYFDSESSEDENETGMENVLKDYDLSPENFESKRLIVKSYDKIDYLDAIDCVSGYKNLYILQYSSVEQAIYAYQYYLSCDEIEYVEPDYIATVQADVNNSSIFDGFSSGYYYEIVDKVESWNSKEIGFDDIKDELAQIQLADVMVAVIDSGVDTDHELLEGRLIESSVNLSSSGEESSCEDDYGHGTHVAGIVADNSLSNVMIKPYKVLNNRGKGTISLISIAVDMAVADGADIINLSLTSEGESQTMTDAIDAATEQNVNVVVAAGNKHADLSQKYYTPACVESAITVSAITKDYTLASYSSYNGTIDIAAPGDDIKSSYLNNTYTMLDGTSMAAPQVAAGLANVKSVNPELSSYEIEEKIKEYSIKMDENDGENCFGAGALYLKYILSVIPRTAEPVFNVEEGEFLSSFKLTLSCPEADAKILYVIYEGDEIQDMEDVVNIGFLNGTEYTESLTISTNTKISAVAYSKGKLFSEIVTREFIRSDKNEEDNYDIDSKGYITGYFGKETDLIVPETIHGITVKGVGNSAFKDDTLIHSVELPSTATVIDTEAFAGCTNLYKVSGEGITIVNKSAFELCTISEFPFEQLETIGISAYAGCNNLSNVNLKNAVNIMQSAFENARDIIEINSSSIISVGEYAFRGTNVETVNLPELTEINISAFQNCYELTSFSSEKVTEIKPHGFDGCLSLNEISMPSLKILGSYAFKNAGLKELKSEIIETIDKYAFSGCAQLRRVCLNNATDVGAYAFNQCTNLKFVFLPTITELNNSIFSSCSSLKSIWLPSVVKVNSWAFNNSSIEYVQFDKVKNIYSLPETLLGIILPSSFSSISAATPETDYVVYGYPNTYAEEYATEKEKEFVTVPAIICEAPEYVSIDEKYIYAYALGFNCTYQWYKNDIVSNENGTLIEGATNFFYEPTRDDNAACYYCVITSDDGVNYAEVVTAPITNIPEYQEADYTEYNSVIEEASLIERGLYTEESLSVLDSLLEQDVSGYSLAEQDLIIQHIAAIKDAISSLMLDYVLGDINADGKISLLDARLALKTVSGTEELSELQTLSADMNKDGKISLIDVRAILRIISEVIEE